MQKIMMEMQSSRAGETDEETYARAMRDPEIQEIMGECESANPTSIC